jgi:hypothetical protein
MIFAENNHPQAIIDGLKTETRRRITALDRYHAGGSYAIQPRRTAKGITQGRILILEKWVELKSKDYPISIEHAYAEGCYTPEEYEKLYEKINPKWKARVAFKFEFIPYPDGIGDSECAKSRTSLNCRNDETPSQEQAEKQKKELYYDPQTCADQDEAGCTYPDCDNCGVVFDDDEDDWEGDYP